MFETALAPDEIVTAVHFPKPEKGAYVKFPNLASRYSMVGVYVARTGGGARRGHRRRALRVPLTDAEAALSQNYAPGAVDGLSVDAGGLNSDIHASAEYRAHLIKVMAKRPSKRPPDLPRRRRGRYPPPPPHRPGLPPCAVGSSR